MPCRPTAANLYPDDGHSPGNFPRQASVGRATVLFKSWAFCCIRYGRHVDGACVVRCYRPARAGCDAICRETRSLADGVRQILALPVVGLFVWLAFHFDPRRMVIMAALSRPSSIST